MTAQDRRHERASGFRPLLPTVRGKGRCSNRWRSGSSARRAILPRAFNVTGKAVVHVGTTGVAGGNPDDVARAVAVQLDGGILLTGMTANGFETDFAVARLNADGSPDTTFGSNCIVVIPVELNGRPLPTDDVEGIALQADGKIVVAVSAGGAAGASDFAAVRLTATRQLDRTFGSGGIQTVSFAGSAKAYAVAIRANGGIVLASGAQSGASSAATSFAMARLTASDSLDAGFGNAGEQTVSFNPKASSQDAAHAVAIAPGGSILLAGVHAAGISGSVFAVARLTPNGTLDTGFGSAGLQSFALSPGLDPDDVANGMALQGNGGIVVGQHGLGVARLTPAGAFDLGFNGSGKLSLVSRIAGLPVCRQQRGDRAGRADPRRRLCGVAAGLCADSAPHRPATRGPRPQRHRAHRADARSAHPGPAGAGAVGVCRRGAGAVRRL